MVRGNRGEVGSPKPRSLTRGACHPASAYNDSGLSGTILVVYDYPEQST